jgi:hypothetical protein
LPVIILRLSDTQMEIVRVSAESRGQKLQTWVSRACDSAALHQAHGGDVAVRAVLDRLGGVTGNGALPPKKPRAARRNAKKRSAG